MFIDPTIPAGGSITRTVTCPEGKVAVGGGYASGNPRLLVYQDTPSSLSNGWLVTADNPTEFPTRIVIRVVCINA